MSFDHLLFDQKTQNQSFPAQNMILVSVIGIIDDLKWYGNLEASSREERTHQGQMS